MQKRFLDQRVLITGASRGIGRALALAFAEEGADLILVARSQALLQEVENEISRLGRKAVSIAVDITHPEQLDQLIERVRKEENKLDILVNNAGKGLYALVQNTPLAEMRDIFELNFFSLASLTQKLLPLLKKSSHPQIINISSIAGHIAVPKMSAYCASKFALNAFSENLRIEHAQEGLHVLSVYPGIIDTDFSSQAKMIDARPDSYITKGRGMPAGKLAQKILKASHKRKRDEYSTLENRMGIIFHTLFPKMMDNILKKMVK